MSESSKTLEAMWPKASDYAVVAKLVRAGLTESFHLGIAALVGPDGKLVDEVGKAKRLIYPRSSVKPLQAVATTSLGAKLEGAHLAISCGSHQGTEDHAALVSEILEANGLDGSALQCPVAWPGDAGARKRATAETRECFNCSGKHAGFLAACVAAGLPTENYLDPNHPLQLKVREVIEDYAGEKILFTTPDGCGAPLHTLTVEGLARAIGRFTRDDTRIVDAMLDNAWAVDGHDTPDTLLMEAGFVAKLGAEGVFVVGTREGFGVAIKIADGNLRAAPLVALNMLRKHDLIDQKLYDDLSEKIAQKVTGGNLVTGKLIATN
jgi:L-asparaginase II